MDTITERLQKQLIAVALSELAANEESRVALFGVADSTLCDAYDAVKAIVESISDYNSFHLANLLSEADVLLHIKLEDNETTFNAIDLHGVKHFSVVV